MSLPKLKLIYDSYEYDSYCDRYRHRDVFISAKKIDGIEGAITVVSLVVLGFYFNSLALSWYFYLLCYPIAAVISSVIIAPFLRVAPKIKYRMIQKENEKLELEKARRREMEALKPKIFSTSEMRNVINEYRNLEVSEVFESQITTITKNLDRLVEAVETNEHDPVKLTKLFKNYLPDIMKLVSDHNDNKDVSENMAEMTSQIVELLSNFARFIDSEIERVSSPKVYGAKATIEVYNKIFNNGIDFNMEDDGDA